MSEPPRIIITGFMGAGKSTVARALAARLSCTLIDLDDFITTRAGRTPQQIIDADGEARFRELETAALRTALAETKVQVIALGGGAWTIAENRALVAQHNGFSVWLDAPFELCWRRITGGDGNERPFARDKKKARTLYEERRTLYALATLRAAPGEHEIEAIVTQIAGELSLLNLQKLKQTKKEETNG